MDKNENELVEQMIEKILKKITYTPMDAQYLTNGSTITRRSLVQICSNTIQVELKFQTQPDWSLSKSRTAQLKAQLCTLGLGSMSHYPLGSTVVFWPAVQLMWHVNASSRMTMWHQAKVFSQQQVFIEQLTWHLIPTFLPPPKPLRLVDGI